jgi:hypothetical protein
MRGKTFNMVYYDEEANERFMKALEEADKKCRDCKHPKYVHIKDRCLAIPGMNISLCSCIEYVPKDNLDYVEWLVKKRKLL